ncbi:MAG TPA: S46 family peptidase [Bacteroidales bacterium]|nr:S46 family peptidase [Bacteroidales bacterium]HPT51686.1 S46 family peptidase [Bacteroidales bacterium]
MKKIFFWALSMVLCMNSFATNPPDEGMWLPMFIKDYNYADMQRMGLKLTPEQLYDINNSSLKDAVVQLGNGFCTGEVVSKDGLMLTNHHCGYSFIVEHSTEEHDYLKNGFCAMSKEEELPNEGFYVNFLVRMDDVTAKIFDNVTDGMNATDRESAISSAIATLESEYSEDGKYTVVVKPFYEGNEYYMFTYITYKDVRLVFAPPSSVGKFGGETDNWMWPRHTGDFSMFRIYTAPDGSPALYSKDNVPLQPKHFLSINLQGVKEGDFSMVWGYPGTTERFMTSYEVNVTTQYDNPAFVGVLDAILPVIRDAMRSSDKIRLGYAEDFASMSNSWKNKKGETESLIKLKVADKKAKQEAALQKWINQDPKRQEKYGTVLQDIKNVCDTLDANSLKALTYSNLILSNSKTMLFPLDVSLTKTNNEEELEVALDEYNTYMEGSDPATEKAIILASLKVWNDVPVEYRPDIFTLINKKYKGNLEKFVDDAFAKSVFSSAENYKKAVPKLSSELLQKDLLTTYIQSLIDVLQINYFNYKMYDQELSSLRTLYLAAVKEMNGSTPMYPDANSTMRMTYGQVLDYYPVDGIHYKYYTTTDGILEKEIPNDAEFDVPAKLKNLILNKDFGKYGKNGTLSVCFLSNNDITGGNSGSPVINGNGELIGIAFDGNWEALSSDIVFNQDLQRCICVDIRYVMFIIDKFGGAGYLLDEMKFVQ